MSSNSSIFTGSSRYSSDLQQVLTRAVKIASLPLNLLNNQLSTLQSRSSALDSMDGKFSALLSETLLMRDCSWNILPDFIRNAESPSRQSKSGRPNRGWLVRGAADRSPSFLTVAHGVFP